VEQKNKKIKNPQGPDEETDDFPRVLGKGDEFPANKNAKKRNYVNMEFRLGKTKPAGCRSLRGYDTLK
jgi:hypothetical protein